MNDKFAKVSAVLEKERTALREVLSNAKAKIKQLTDEHAPCGPRLAAANEEIERLKKKVHELPMSAGQQGSADATDQILQAVTILKGGLRLLSSNYKGLEQLACFHSQWASFISNSRTVQDFEVSTCGRLTIELGTVLEQLLARAETAENKLADAQAQLAEQQRKLMELNALLECSQTASPRNSMSPRNGEAALRRHVTSLSNSQRGGGGLGGSPRSTRQSQSPRSPW